MLHMTSFLGVWYIRHCKPLNEQQIEIIRVSMHVQIKNSYYIFSRIFKISKFIWSTCHLFVLHHFIYLLF